MSDEPRELAVETVAIGDECFGTKNGDRVCWRGRNYVPQDQYEADMLKFADRGDELKDFRYYADKAEALLASTADIFPTSIREGEAVTAVAAVLAELAKAAPKVEPEPVLPCNVGLHGYLDGRYTGSSRPCIFVKGHAGEHRTGDGVFFTGLDNADFPGLGGK